MPSRMSAPCADSSSGPPLDGVSRPRDGLDGVTCSNPAAESLLALRARSESRSRCSLSPLVGLRTIQYLSFFMKFSAVTTHPLCRLHEAPRLANHPEEILYVMPRLYMTAFPRVDR